SKKLRVSYGDENNFTVTLPDNPFITLSEANDELKLRLRQEAVEALKNAGLRRFRFPALFGRYHIKLMGDNNKKPKAGRKLQSSTAAGPASVSAEEYRLKILEAVAEKDSKEVVRLTREMRGRALLDQLLARRNMKDYDFLKIQPGAVILSKDQRGDYVI